MCAAEVNINGRCCIEHGLYDVVGAVDVRCTYNLNVCLCGAAVLAYECCYVLEHVGCEASLDHEHVIVAFNRLHDTQVIYVTVIVEVEVGEHE